MKKSTLWSLTKSDFLKGLILAVIQTVLAGLIVITNNYITSGGVLPSVDQWQMLGGAAILTFLSYIGKNFGTNSEDKFLKKEIK